MSNDYRNESRRTPPATRYGTPGTTYPTPNPYDVVITEEVTNRAQAFEPVLFGTPHPVVTAAVLCHQGDVRSNNTDKAPIRVYANPRLAQEPYNLVNGNSDANDPNFPIFVRSYLLPRGYTKPTLGTPLTALIGLALVSGGTGYTPTAGSCKLPLAFSGGSGSGAAGFAEIVAGIVVAVLLTNTGTGYTSAPTVSVTGGGGSGVSITALLQPTTAGLTDEDEHEAEEPYGGFFVRVTRTWEVLPGTQLLGHERSVAVRGRTVDTNTQKGVPGIIAVEVDAFIISSSVTPLSKGIDERTTKSISSLPPDEVSAFWDFVPIPTLLFDIANTIFCNGSQFASLVTNPVKGGGSSVIRKHRKTVSYSLTLPDPDLSGAAVTTADLEYRGKMIQFSYQNALNDAISYNEDLALTSGGSACAWTEAYDFSASSPSATDFAAGAWYTKSFIPEPWGESMWKSTLIEFYSAPGNPAI